MKADLRDGVNVIVKGFLLTNAGKAIYKMDKEDTTELEKLKDLLRDNQLDQFYRQIHGKLHIARLSHFDHVTEEDLDDLGMAKPEQRRLFEAVKKAKKKPLFSSFKRKKSKRAESIGEAATERTSCYGIAGESLTCLISVQSLTLYEMLGNGAFGYVRRGKWMKDSHKKLNVAVKCLKACNDQAFQQMQMEFIKEANAMSLLDHPHIIRLYGIVLSVPMMLVTELAPLGCLLTRLRDEPQNFTINGLSDFVVQIASGMAYLESQRFVHRDLAARNLLLESYEKVKIGDFGMMRVLSGDDDHYTMHPSGKVPFAWCPQEVLKFRKFSHSSDVWAFGITVLELFSYGVEPWPGLNGAEVLDKVDMPLCERPKKPDHCPSEIYNILMLHCWAHEPHQRARFSVLKKLMDEAHPVNVAAVFPYESKCQDNLSFKAGDIVTLLDASPETSWWKGQNMRTNRVGMFPSELVDKESRQAVSPVSHRTSPKQRSLSRQPSERCGQLPNCACGSVHIYETPVLLDSVDPFTTSSRRSTSQSSRSAESDLTSSTEVDSGYSSSVDIRRFNLLNGESSPEQHKANFGASYENTSIGMENRKNPMNAYEFMSPPFTFGSVSSPISIPKQGSGESWHARGDYNIPPTPVSTEGKCPLNFGNFFDPHFSDGKGESPPPLSAKTSASLPNTSTVQTSLQEPRLSKTSSPPSSKRTSSSGETFAPEMLTFQKEVNIQKSTGGSSSKPEEDDVYEELAKQSDIPADLPGNRANSTTSRDSLKAHNENSYENHHFHLMFKSQKEGDGLDCGYDRIQCNSAHQPQRGREVFDARCNSWPIQQNYDNHKLRDVGSTVSPSQNCCYDNHRLRSLETALSPSDLCYDNWKIKNEECNVSEKKKRPSCYENAELLNGEEICHGTETSCSAEKTGSSNKTSIVAQSYENCLPKSAKTSYENFTPKHLQGGSFGSDQKGVSTLLYENCEVLDKKTKTSETLKGSTSGNRDRNGCHFQGLSSSLPMDCCCVDVIHEDNECMSIIIQKRTLPTLARSTSVNVIENADFPVDASKGDAIGLGLSGDSDENHPIPPPRWKRIARLSQLLSVEGCSQAKWSVSLNPEIASALRKRCNGAAANDADDTPIKLQNDSHLVQDPQTEALESEKTLPPHVKASSAVAINKQLNMTCSAYENVLLQSKNSTEEISSGCPPELPPKKKQSTGSESSSKSNTTTRTLHYENVDLVNGYHVESNRDVASELESCTPPPLPRKMSQKKGGLVIPCRIDLEQKC